MTEIYQILYGLLIGYLAVSVCESYFHRTIGHASPRLRLLWRKMRKLGAPFLRSWYSHHVVHHFKTFRRDHVTQFSCPDEERRLRLSMIAKGHGHVVGQSYGVRVGSPGEFFRYVGPTLPA